MIKRLILFGIFIFFINVEIHSENPYFINGNKYYTTKNYIEAIKSFENAIKFENLTKSEFAETLYKLGKSNTFINRF